MNEITLVLPYPPSVNHYKKVGKIVRTSKGKIYQYRSNTAETNEFYHKVFWICRNEGFKSFNGATIKMEVHLHPPDKRRRDIDGPLKVLLDSLQRANIYDDDCQIYKLIVCKKWIERSGLVIVKICPFDTITE